VPWFSGVPSAWRKCFLLEHRWGGVIAPTDADLLADELGVAPLAYTRTQQPSFNGVRTLKWSFMRMPAGQFALYDNELDPRQHVDVSIEKPDQRNRLQALTTAFVGCSGQSCRNIELTEQP
jgi:hypothetical protein